MYADSLFEGRISGKLEERERAEAGGEEQGCSAVVATGTRVMPESRASCLVMEDGCLQRGHRNHCLGTNHEGGRRGKT